MSDDELEALLAPDTGSKSETQDLVAIISKSMSPRQLGSVMMLVAVLCGAFNGTLLRVSEIAGMGSPAILATRWLLFGTFMVANECLLFNDRWALIQLVSSNRDLLLYGVLCGVVFACGTISMLQTQCLNAVVLSNTFPLYSVLFSALLLQDPIEKRTLVALAAAMPFVFMLILPAALDDEPDESKSHQTGAHKDSAVGDIIMFVSALGFAAYITATRYANTVRPGTVPCVIIGYGMGVIVMGIGAAVYTTIVSSFNGSYIGYCAILVDITLLVGWARLAAAASSYLTVPEVSLLSLLDILFGPAIVMLIYHEYANWLQLVAGICIFFIMVVHEATAEFEDEFESQLAASCREV